MLFFRYRYGIEHRSNFCKALFLRFCGKRRVHIRPLVVFTVGCFLQIIFGAPDNACGKSRGNFELSALKKLEETFCVFLFLIGSFRKNIGYLHIPFFLCFRSKIGVAVSRLTLTGEGLQQVFFRFGTLKTFHVDLLFSIDYYSGR